MASLIHRYGKRNARNEGILTKIEARPSSRFDSCYSVEAKFFLDTGSELLAMGRCFGLTIDKSFSTAQYRSRRRIDWRTELLTRPEDYQCEAHKFSGDDGDDLTDMQKALQLIFEPSGSVRKGIKTEHGFVLSKCTRLHIIEYLSVKKEYRGKQGYPQAAMNSYIEAMQRLSGGFGFNGPVLVAPAPLVEAWLEENPQGTKQWIASKEKIARSYQRSDFEMCYAGDLKENDAISVMIRLPSELRKAPRRAFENWAGRIAASVSMGVPATVPSSEAAFSDSTFDAQAFVSSSQQPRLAEGFGPVDRRIAPARPKRHAVSHREVQRLQGEDGAGPTKQNTQIQGTYLWKDGTRYAITPDTPREWLEAWDTQREARAARVSAPKASRASSDKPEEVYESPNKFWPAKEILQEGKRGYLVRWKGINPRTNKPWADSWITTDLATEGLIADWQYAKNMRTKEEKGKQQWS